MNVGNTPTNLGMTTTRSLDGKLAIVTGGSRGIGAAICRNLAKKGCNLVTNYSSPSSAEMTEKLVAELSSSYNIKAVCVQVNLSRADEPQKLIAAALEQFGKGSKESLTIDILINNAGISNNFMIAEQKVDDFHEQYNVNVLAPLLLLQAALPYLPHGTEDDPTPGRIINVSSVSASLGFAGQTTYGGTKAALESMTRTWARELVGRATCNAVNPGPVATDMYASASSQPGFADNIRPWLEHTPGAQSGQTAREKQEKGLGGREGTPDEIAGVIGMLVGPDSAWCNGSVICANGGFRFSE